MNHLSGYRDWKELSHSSAWLLYEKNIGKRLSIDETSISQGELHTIITNKEAKGRKGALVAIIKGTNSSEIIEVLSKIDSTDRDKVEEITLDMASSMYKISRSSFPKAIQVIDRFHVAKLVSDAVQEIRIKYRWEAIDQENKELSLCKEMKKKFIPNRLQNGDTHKQLLARSRYLLFKSRDKWTHNQELRSEILFYHYPDIEKAYKLAQSLSKIYESTKNKNIALTKLAQWYKKVEEAEFKSFNIISNTIQSHYQRIVNYFINRSTNASAESFNAKIKAFRSQLRGVRDNSFFFFRLAKIYA